MGRETERYNSLVDHLKTAALGNSFKTDFRLCQSALKLANLARWDSMGLEEVFNKAREGEMDEALVQLGELKESDFFRAALLLLWIEANRQEQLPPEKRSNQKAQAVVWEVNRRLPRGKGNLNWSLFLPDEFWLWWIEKTKDLVQQREWLELLRRGPEERVLSKLFYRRVRKRDWEGAGEVFGYVQTGNLSSVYTFLKEERKKVLEEEREKIDDFFQLLEEKRETSFEMGRRESETGQEREDLSLEEKFFESWSQVTKEEKLKDAEKMAGATSGAVDSIKGWEKISLAWEEKGEKKEGEKLFEKTLDLLENVEDQTPREVIAYGLAEKMVEVSCFELARRVIAEIEDLNWKNKARALLAFHLARDGRDREGQNIFMDTIHPGEGEEAQKILEEGKTLLAETLAETENLEKARHLFHTVEDFSLRLRVQGRIALLDRKEESWQSAFAIFQQMDFHRHQSEKFEEAAFDFLEILLSARKYGRALEVLSSMVSNQEKGFQIILKSLEDHPEDLHLLWSEAEILMERLSELSRSDILEFLLEVHHKLEKSLTEQQSLLLRNWMGEISRPLKLIKVFHKMMDYVEARERRSIWIEDLMAIVQSWANQDNYKETNFRFQMMGRLVVHLIRVGKMEESRDFLLSLIEDSKELSPGRKNLFLRLFVVELEKEKLPEEFLSFLTPELGSQLHMNSYLYLLKSFASLHYHQGEKARALDWWELCLKKGRECPPASRGVFLKELTRDFLESNQIARGEECLRILWKETEERHRSAVEVFYSEALILLAESLAEKGKWAKARQIVSEVPRAILQWRGVKKLWLRACEEGEDSQVESLLPPLFEIWNEIDKGEDQIKALEELLDLSTLLALEEGRTFREKLAEMWTQIPSDYEKRKTLEKLISILLEKDEKEGFFSILEKENLSYKVKRFAAKCWQQALIRNSSSLASLRKSFLLLPRSRVLNLHGIMMMEAAYLKEGLIEKGKEIHHLLFGEKGGGI